MAGCLLSPVIPIGGGPQTAREGQRQTLGKLLPAPLATAHTWSGAVRTGKLRVWADADHRAQNARWQHAFEEQLDGVNQLLVPLLGVRLEAEYRAWEVGAPRGPLREHLERLEAHDPGEDVVCVVGLTSSLALVSPTFEELGLAYQLGRHSIVRGHADLEERRAFERAFPDLDTEEREAVLEARRRHKTTVVLLHEIAHNLGALHEAADGGVMGRQYTHRVASIGDANRALMQIELEERLAPPGKRDPRAAAARVVAALDADPDVWVEEDRAEVAATLRVHLADRAGGAAGGQAAGAAAGGGIAGPVPGAAGEELRRAQAMLARGDHAGAERALEPLAAAYPAHVEVRLLACKLELARGDAKGAKAAAVCRRAVQLSPGPGPAIAYAQALAAAGDPAAARAILLLAEEQLARQAPAAAESEWLALAAQYRAMSAVTWAEDALAKSGSAAGSAAARPVAQWVETSRVRYGIPRQGARWKLAPEEDAAALAAVQGVLDRVYAGKLAAAAQDVARAEARWPALPGLLAVRCDLELRRGARAAARRQCQRAIAEGPSSWALYLLGIIELGESGPAATTTGIARLREAIALDPELGQAWRALAKALRRAKMAPELQQLGRDYHAQFGGVLPP